MLCLRSPDKYDIEVERLRTYVVAVAELSPGITCRISQKPSKSMSLPGYLLLLLWSREN